MRSRAHPELCSKEYKLLIEKDPCAEVKSNSLLLNQLAKNALIQARSGSTDNANFTFAADWMEAKDKCDPETLRHSPTPCAKKILKVLSSYVTALDKVARFASCSASVSRVKPTSEALRKSVSACVQLNNDVSKEAEEPRPRPDDVAWQEEPLCYYTLKRLFSFSLLTARVFAVGHPAAHSQGSAHVCK
ncbi:uncharacterized protein ACBT44_020848 isoform 2-T2 [Syngnathus typhle]